MTTKIRIWDAEAICTDNRCLPCYNDYSNVESQSSFIHFHLHQIQPSTPSSVISRPSCFSSSLYAAAGRWAQRRSSVAVVTVQRVRRRLQIFRLTYLLTVVYSHKLRAWLQLPCDFDYSTSNYSRMGVESKSNRSRNHRLTYWSGEKLTTKPFASEAETTSRCIQVTSAGQK